MSCQESTHEHQPVRDNNEFVCTDPSCQFTLETKGYCKHTPCKVEGCTSVRSKKGFCSKHYQRWKRHGSTEALKTKNRGPCDVDGCNEKAVAKGYCRAHYDRYHLYGDPTLIKRPSIVKHSRCLVDNCINAPVSRGYCRRHYGRLIRTGTTELVKAVKECLVDGCTKSPKRKGYCTTHYERLKKYGTVDKPTRKPRPKCAFKGCRRVARVGDFCLNHTGLTTTLVSGQENQIRYQM